MSYRTKNIITFLLFVVTLWVVVPWEGKPLNEKLKNYATLKLGLDLKGGTELRLEFSDKENIENLREATNKATDILHERINRYGLTEPRIQPDPNDGQILVQIPGTAKDVERINRILTTTGHLEFRIVAPRDVINRNDPSQSAPAGYEWMEQKNGAPLLVEKEVQMTGKDIQTASVRKDPQNPGYMISVNYNMQGGEKLARITREHTGRRMAIVMDGQIQSAPTLQEEITGGQASITGQFNFEEANDLSTILESGQMAAPLETISQYTVGPSLGEDSIRRGKNAIIFAIVLVLLFMLFYYRSLGLVADVTLLLNLLLLFTFVELIGATLTLPGIAGVVLTVGMAVDASVIIFERIRQELDEVESSRAAFESGWDRAFWAVFDANITTFIIAVILAAVGTGPIKGFANILMIGIITTLFSVFFSERALINGMLRMKFYDKFHMFRFFSGTDFSFMKKIPITVGVTSVALFVSVAAFTMGAAQGGKIFSIDFMGGNLFTVRFSKPAEAETVRQALQNYQLKNSNITPYRNAEIQGVQISGEDQKQKNTLYQIRMKGSKFQELRNYHIRKDFPRILEKFTPSLSFSDDNSKTVKLNLENVQGVDQIQNQLRNFSYPKSRIQPYNNVIVEAEDQNNGVYTVQLRKGVTQNLVRQDLMTVFQDYMSPKPFQVFESQNSTHAQISLQKPVSLKQARSKIQNALSEVGPVPFERGLVIDPVASAQNSGSSGNGNQSQDGSGSHKLYQLTFHPNVARKVGEYQSEMVDALSSGGFSLTSDPFQQITTIGASVAGELKRAAFIAIILACIGIVVYLMIRFQFSFGVGAVLAVLHDLVITVGMMALFDLLLADPLNINMDIGLASLAAFLTVIGYSVNDTIVTFDRIRELIREKRRATFGEIIDESINLNLSRTILTSLTTFLAVLVLFVLTRHSGSDIVSFAFPILIGVISGTYSSIFIASPSLVYLPYVGESKDKKASRL